VAAAGKEAGLTDTKVVAAGSVADSGADRGMVEEVTAAAAGGQGGAEEAIENARVFYFY
jgi:hypothetical protein